MDNDLFFCIYEIKILHQALQICFYLSQTTEYMV